jgi:hypothetical protein
VVNLAALPPEAVSRIFTRMEVAGERLREACEPDVESGSGTDNLAITIAATIYDKSKEASEEEAARYEREWDEAVRALAKEVDK